MFINLTSPVGYYVKPSFTCEKNLNAISVPGGGIRRPCGAGRPPRPSASRSAQFWSLVHASPETTTALAQTIDMTFKFSDFQILQISCDTGHILRMSLLLSAGQSDDFQSA